MRIKKITLLVLFLFFLVLPLKGNAASCPGKTGKIQLSVYIPGVTKEIGEGCYYLEGGLPDYIAGLYNFGLAIGGFLAVLMVMIGGAQWVMAGGAADKITRAKERIMNAIAGLILLLLSYTILYTINPDVVKLKEINPKKVPRQQTPYEQRVAAALALKLEILKNFDTTNPNLSTSEINLLVSSAQINAAETLEKTSERRYAEASAAELSQNEERAFVYSIITQDLVRDGEAEVAAAEASKANQETLNSLKSNLASLKENATKATDSARRVSLLASCKAYNPDSGKLEPRGCPTTHIDLPMDAYIP